MSHCRLANGTPSAQGATSLVVDAGRNSTSRLRDQPAFTGLRVPTLVAIPWQSCLRQLVSAPVCAARVPSRAAREPAACAVPLRTGCRGPALKWCSTKQVLKQDQIGFHVWPNHRHVALGLPELAFCRDRLFSATVAPALDRDPAPPDPSIPCALVRAHWRSPCSPFSSCDCVELLSAWLLVGLSWGWCASARADVILHAFDWSYSGIAGAVQMITDGLGAKRVYVVRGVSDRVEP